MRALIVVVLGTIIVSSAAFGADAPGKWFQLASQLALADERVEPPSADTVPEADEPGTATWSAGWWIRGEAVFMQRSDPRERLLIQNTATPGIPVALTNRDAWDSGRYAPGMRLTAGRILTEKWAMEVEYFGLARWTGKAAAVDNDGGMSGSLFPAGHLSNLLNSLFNTYGAWGGAARVEIDTETEIHSLELNVLHRLDEHCPGLSCLFGIRYLNLDEEFSMRVYEQFPFM
jgi:hypothetical protein